MTSPQVLLLAIGFLAVGLWLMLPRGNARGRGWGAALSVIGIMAMIQAGSLAGQLPLAAPWGYRSVVWLLGGITVVSALGAVVMRNPVYCALWFALSLLGTAGLMLLIGAQFLALATVVVYAGAIVVTFLFVLMLAQPEGQAYYDRISWEAALSAITGALMIGCLTAAISRLPYADLQPDAATLKLRDRSFAVEQHVAELGGRLFSEHLIAVEIAALLLLVALIGATAMVRQGAKPPSAEGEGVAESSVAAAKGGPR
ncbi:MAG: hypothetical protein GTO53_05270 [Planctomycetales bacterium]|nr:hypothetical protein [Planctomycetales bacterium]NIM08559.1 hypothetical protein [Planctomycetales bacterium]NIN08030.1 hypothetical protein [Planctomycetales bacterium]NIN77166.1 hypothetical protein [Planctomycetales bacterium]NIO34348.1 hypothetical protein [Planctomycetales bacterium]